MEQLHTLSGQLQDQLREWVANQSETFTMDDVISRGMNQEPDEVGRGTRTAIGNALKQLGFMACKVRLGKGYSGYVYKRVN